MLRRRPGSAMVAIATMALGIGAATILFSVAWNVLAKPLPWPDADRLVRIIETRQGSTRRLPPIVTNGTYLAWRGSASTVEEIAGWAPPLWNRPPRCGHVCRRSNPSADGGCGRMRDAGAPGVATRPVAGLEGTLIRWQ
jgi:hypothetical protein